MAITSRTGLVYPLEMKLMNRHSEQGGGGAENCSEKKNMGLIEGGGEEKLLTCMHMLGSWGGGEDFSCNVRRLVSTPRTIGCHMFFGWWLC